MCHDTNKNIWRGVPLINLIVCVIKGIVLMVKSCSYFDSLCKNVKNAMYAKVHLMSIAWVTAVEIWNQGSEKSKIKVDVCISLELLGTSLLLWCTDSVSKWIIYRFKCSGKSSRMTRHFWFHILFKRRHSLAFPVPFDVNPMLFMIYKKSVCLDRQL